MPKPRKTIEDKIDLSQKIFTNLYDEYLKTEKRLYFKGCIIGPPKSGKTSSIVTAPKPILVLNFDPTGLQAIDHYLRDPESRIYVKDFSGDTPWSAEQYPRFIKMFEDFEAEGTFDQFATVFIDSQTSLIESQMAYIVNKAVRSGKPRVEGVQPAVQDFQQQKLMMLNLLTRLFTLDCHVVIFGHEITVFDSENNVYNLITIGSYGGKSLPANLPTKFTEYYNTQVREVDRDQFEYSWITVKSSSRQYVGSSLARFDRKTGKRTTLPHKVPQNFRKLFKLLDLNWEDKE